MSEKHSKSYQKYKERYDRNGCTKKQLHRLVELGAITSDEYAEITGETYSES